MATIYNDNNQVNAPKDIDNKTGKFVTGAWVPYASILEANTAILLAYRYLGLRVRITEGSSWAWYIYRDGIADGNLVREEGFYKFRTVSADTTALITDSGDNVIIIDATSANVTLSVSPATFTGRTLKVIGVTSGNLARVTATSGTIVGQSGVNYDVQNGEFVTFLSNGTNLYVMAKN